MKTHVTTWFVTQCRVGLLPAIRRPLAYLTAAKPSGGPTDVPSLQPVLSKVRFSKQANKQPRRSADFASHVHTMPECATATGNRAAIGDATGNSMLQADSSVHCAEHTMHQPSHSQQARSMSQAGSPQRSDKGDVMQGMDVLQLGRIQQKSSKSPKRSLSERSTASRQSTRNKSVRADH